MTIDNKTYLKLRAYPILHRFLAELYTRCDIYKTEDMLEYIEDDYVLSYSSSDGGSATSLYLMSNRVPVFDEGEKEYVETYDSDKGLIVLHFDDIGKIEIEALEYDNYPFKDELIAVYNDDNLKYALESDLEVELQQEKVEEAQAIVNEYFNKEPNILNTIIID